MNKPLLSVVRPNPLTLLAREAGAKLSALIMTGETVHPSRDYCNSLADDLNAIRDIIDPLILAIGAQAQRDTGQLDKNDLDGCFKDQLRNALEGNAEYILRDTVPDLMRECAADDAADYRREAQQDDRFADRVAGTVTP